MPDTETEAAAVLVGAAFDGASPAERRALWRKLRAAISDTRGATWRPGAPWSGLLAELSRAQPTRWVTTLGAAPSGQTNQLGGSRPAALPWAWPTGTGKPRPAARTSTYRDDFYR